MTHNAPPGLRYPLVRPPPALGWGLLALAALSATGLLGWALQGAGPAPWAPALGLLLWLGVAMAARHCWRHWPEGQLEWDGAQWWLRSGRRVLPLAAPEPCWDGQRFLLLRVPGPRPQRWLWLARAAAPAQWGDLRRAVYWRPRPARNA